MYRLTNTGLGPGDGVRSVPNSPATLQPGSTSVPSFSTET